MEPPFQSVGSQKSPPTKRCHYCQRLFTRNEHLTRHIRSHTREMPFGCSTCGKHFTRQDILNRHAASHGLEPDIWKAQASPRACVECAIGRARCSRGTPCTRCSQRGLVCKYPTQRKRRAALGRGGGGAESQDPADQSDTPNAVQQEAPSDENGARVLVGRDGLVSVPPTNNPPEVPWDDRWMGDAAMPEEPPTCDSFGRNSHSMGDMQGLNDLQSFAPSLSSMNWVSADDDMTRNWALQLDSLYGPAVPESPVALPIPSALQMAHENGRSWHPESTTGLDIAEAVLATPSGGEVVEYPQEPTVSASECSRTDIISTGSVSSKYYTAGAGVRAPFHGNSHERLSKADVPALSELPLGALSAEALSATPGHDMVSSGGYNELLQNVRAECEAHCLDADLACFPSPRHIAVFAKLYFDKFHPIFPFISKDSVSGMPHQWILLLAVATVGARYSGRQSSSSKRFLVRLLRVIVHHRWHLIQHDEDGRPSSLGATEGEAAINERVAFLQAAVLNCICMFHSGKAGLMRQAAFQRSYLVETGNMLDLFCPPGSRLQSPLQMDESTALRLWSRAQSMIRTGFMIWLVDYLISYESHTKPLMQMLDASGSLPCPEDIWEVPSAEKILAHDAASVTLYEALESLYIEKRLPPSLGEFAATLLIHGVCRRTTEVYRQNQTQLSAWIPSARAQPRRKNFSADESWPPSTALLSNWRNSACDSLDLLHWAANGKAAQSGGWEHATILHLHIARLILLTPTRHLATLIPPVSGAAEGVGTDEYARTATARQAITQWAIRDRFKARLAVIHAGALFWHVRRYSADCVVEPYGIYMATLVVWGYSVTMRSVGSRDRDRDQAEGEERACSEDTSRNVQESPGTAQDGASPTLDDSDSEPMFIRLDRPCDDEMVQTFMRIGDKMTGYMLRIGNICGKKAPERILSEGIRLLVGADGLGNPETLASGQLEDENDTWGIERTYAESLRRLLYATNCG